MSDRSDNEGETMVVITTIKGKSDELFNSLFS